MNDTIATQLLTEIRAIRVALQPGPNYRRSLKAYPKFDFASIGAEVVASDKVGATIVMWGGHVWKRRFGTGKFGDAIWFSRSAGKDDDGENEYHCLVKFQPMDTQVETLPDELIRKLK